MAIAIRRDIPVGEVYERAKEEKHAKVRARLLAIGAILEGKSRTYAAKLAGITLTNIRRWIKGFNENGFEGLRAKKQIGRPRLWTSEAEQFLKEKALKGASFEVDERVTYRLKDFQTMLKKEFNLDLTLPTIWYKLKALGLSWISVRQRHPKSKPLAQEEFKKKCPLLSSAFKELIPQKN
jgi:transposase